MPERGFSKSGLLKGIATTIALSLNKISSAIPHLNETGRGLRCIIYSSMIQIIRRSDPAQSVLYLVRQNF